MERVVSSIWSGVFLQNIPLKACFQKLPDDFIPVMSENQNMTPKKDKTMDEER